MGAAASFIIPGHLPSMNKIIDAAKLSPHSYKNMKQQHTDKVVIYAKKAKLPAMGRINIKVTWICDTMRQDKDNVCAGIKFILDGLQEAGIIKKDSWKLIGNIEHVFEIDRKNPRIEVELVEAPEGEKL